MKAIIRTKAGKDFSTMKVTELQSPIVRNDELKIRMASSRINPVDMDLMKGFPTLKYKEPQIGGIDGAGEVIEVGGSAKGFKKGDKVMFYRKFSDIGTWAQEITVQAKDCAIVPESISLQEAGSIALPLLTAYDCLMQLNPKKGEKILIHGVGGGVGFQALQVAKRLGLYVIGTASGGNKDLLQKAGLDQFIDYKAQDFSHVLTNKQVDLILDILGGEVLSKSIELQPEKVVSVKYVDPSQMQKAGVNLPGILKWILKLSMRKFDKQAKRNKVQLMGQVTGANGRLLQEAVNCIQDTNITRSYKSRTIADIEKNGMSKNDIGKVITF